MNRRLLFGLALGIVGLVAGRRLTASLRGAMEAPAPGAHTYVLERSHAVRAPIDGVWPFFAAPENLARLTPKSMGFRILHLENPPMQLGTVLEYEIRPFRVPHRWRTEIVEYEPGHRFVDLQTSGPYRYWRHEHTFDAIDGVTYMQDRIEYQLPLGPLGRVAHALLVARQLDRIFDYREQAIEEIFT